MGLSFGGFTEAVTAALGHPPEDLVSTNEIAGVINDSYFEVARRFRHRRMQSDATITTVSGTNEYALESDYFWMRVVRDETNNENLLSKSLDFIQSRNDGINSQPLYWATEDYNIILSPTPDDAYTIRTWYMARPARLRDPADSSVFEDEWDEIIKLGAEARAFYIMGEYDRQIHAKNLQRSLMNTIQETQTLEKLTGVEVAGPLTTLNEPRL